MLYIPISIFINMYLYDNRINLLLETLFIGIYSLVLYSILAFVIKKPLVYVLFILGVMKHALGYFSGLQTFYCQAYNGPEQTAVLPTGSDVFLEGLLYIIVGGGFFQVTKNPYIISFLTGSTIHLGFEFTGFHDVFLRTRCSHSI